MNLAIRPVGPRKDRACVSQNLIGGQPPGVLRSKQSASFLAIGCLALIEAGFGYLHYTMSHTMNLPITVSCRGPPALAS